MFQKDVYAGHTMQAVRDSSPLPASSLRDTITATIIREEAAESLLSSIHGDAELVALVHVLNSYKASWWLKHLSCVGADPARYWSRQLGEEIKAATRSRNRPSQRKKFLEWFFRSFTASARYELSDLELDPL